MTFHSSLSSSKES